jgi:cytochrome b561
MAKPAASTPWHFSAPAIALHWLLAALIVFMAALGWFMMTVEHEPGGERFMNLHKSVGLIVLALVLLRVLWRLTHKPQPLPAAVPRWQVWLSAGTQALLYVLIVAIPLTGIAGSEYSRAGLAFFGIPLPAGFTPDRAVSHLCFEIHSTLVWVLVAALALHVAGGLKHLLVDHDGVFARMWPRRSA